MKGILYIIAVTLILSTFAGMLLYRNSYDVQQEWVQRYDYQQGGQQAVSIAVDDSCNVYVTGTSVSWSFTCLPFLTAYATIKYNSYGVQQWVQHLSLGGSCAAASIAIDDSSNVYVTGTVSYGSGGYGIGTTKYSSLGILRWIQIYRSYYGSSDTTSAHMIKVDRWHNAYVTGRSKDSVSFRDYTTIKYSATGVQQWAARYNGPVGGVDEASALAVDDSGNVYVTGTSQGIGAQQTDIATVKYNSAGTQQWVQRYVGVLPHSSNRGTAITLDNAGNVYVTGSGTISGFPNDIVTIKYNSAGVQQWVSGYNGGTGAGSGQDLKVDNYSNVYVTGSSGGSEASVDRATLKYNSNGVQQWVARYHSGPNTYSEGWSIALDSTVNVYVTGRSGNGSTNDDYLTIKYSNAGVQQWLATYNGPGNGWDAAGSIAVDKKSNVYVTGTSLGKGTGEDYATIKYSQLVGIRPQTSELPTEYRLYQNFPNPFNPVTRIKFAVPLNKGGERGLSLKLVIYDILGREVAVLVDKSLNPGTYEVEWSATSGGANYPSGVYFYELSATGGADAFSEVKRMVLLK